VLALWLGLFYARATGAHGGLLAVLEGLRCDEEAEEISVKKEAPQK
jgi:hypothetical protein